MKMEGGVVDRRRGEINGVGYVNNNKVIRKKKRKEVESDSGRKRRMKRELPISFVLQELYLACKSCFEGPGFVPPPHDIQTLCRILDGMRPEDVGISKNLSFFKPGNLNGEKPRVICTNIFGCENFSLVLLFLPESAVIPFHNHPDMTVFSKLLYGTLHIKSYDWFVDSTDTDNNKRQSSKSRPARLVTNDSFTAPCNTAVLYPTTGGNIHQFTAITPCVVLDVIGPPYSKEDGRDCSYYRESTLDGADSEATCGDGEVEDGGSHGWLEEIEAPDESVMEGIEYLGPRIIEM